MFTGIIQAIGRIEKLTPKGGDVELTIHVADLDLTTTVLGDSIAVNGVCLTAVALNSTSFTADVSVETINCTTLKTLKVGTAVNLEKALTLQTPLGGHLVSGHVDGVGTLSQRYADARSERYVFTAPSSIAKYIATKGAITINGISLTVNAVDGDSFSVNIVPHTQSKTTLGDLTHGDEVNLEVDLIARYVERLVTYGDTGDKDASLLAKLSEAGFIKR